MTVARLQESATEMKPAFRTARTLAFQAVSPDIGAMNGSAPRVTAVLGPTNTGKTHLAMERMLGHASGMIGFPLRLLARENYERVVKAKGDGRRGPGDRRREDRPALGAILHLHGRIHAARQAGGFRRHR